MSTKTVRARGNATPSKRRAPVAMAKVSLTIDQDVLKLAAANAEAAGLSLSAYVTTAVDRAVRRQKLGLVLAGYESEHGAISQADVERARSLWRASR